MKIFRVAVTRETDGDSRTDIYLIEDTKNNRAVIESAMGNEMMFDEDELDGDYDIEESVEYELYVR